jgi:hypothetical protein
MVKDKLIIIIYVGVAGVRSEDIPYFIEKITKKIAPSTFEGELIIIPTQSFDTKIECINPKYITNEELINEHTEMMKNLKEQLQFQLDILKNKNNE